MSENYVGVIFPGVTDYHRPYEVEKDEYGVYLPHSCDEWVIAAGTKEHVIAEVEEHIGFLQAALDEIRTSDLPRAEGGNDE